MPLALNALQTRPNSSTGTLTRVEVQSLEEVDRERVNLALGETSCAISLELTERDAANDGFGHDRTGGIAGAEKQNILGSMIHRRRLSFIR